MNLNKIYNNLLIKLKLNIGIDRKKRKLYINLSLYSTLFLNNVIVFCDSISTSTILL